MKIGDTLYLTVDNVLELHRVLIQRYGGIDGIRSPAAIEVAVFRPQSGYYPDIFGEAAALLESLANNHPFLDGNKRIAFAVMDVFLRINGYCLHANAMAIYGFMLRLFDSGHFDFEYLDSWLRTIVIKQTHVQMSARIP